MSLLKSLIIEDFLGFEIKDKVTELTEDEMDKNQIILKQYLGMKPFDSNDVIGIRVTKYFNGKYIELFLDDGTRCFWSDDLFILNRSDVAYKLPDSVEVAIDVLNMIIPRFKDVVVDYSNVGSERTALNSEYWESLDFDSDYLKRYMKANYIKKLDRKVFDALVKFADEWNDSSLIQSIGREAYEGWHETVNKIYVECSGILKDIIEKEKTYSETNEKEILEEKKKAIVSAGIRGEQDVFYALKWLNKDYKVISDKPIRIKNEKFIDEEQEYDHIVIGPTGVFLIETKSYSGLIEIDKNGNWKRRKNESDDWVGELNPLQQVRRHEKLIQSILPSEIPVHSIVCLAKSNVIIDGIENSPLDIVKADMLAEYIENTKIGNVLNEIKILEVEKLIAKHIV